MFDFNKIGLNLSEMEDTEEVKGNVEPVSIEENDEVQFGCPEAEAEETETRPSFAPLEETAKQLVSDIISAESSVNSHSNEVDTVSDKNGLKWAKNGLKTACDENTNRYDKNECAEAHEPSMSPEEFAEKMKHEMERYSEEEKKVVLNAFKTKEERDSKAAIAYRDELISVCDQEIEKLKHEKAEIVADIEKVKEETEARLKEKDLKLDEFFKNKQSLEKMVEDLKHTLDEKMDVEHDRDEAKTEMEMMKEKMGHLEAEVETYKQQLAENEKGHKLLKAKYEATTDMLRSEEELRTKAEASVSTLRQELVELYNKFVEKC